jgi:hypothetical protein
MKNFFAAGLLLYVALAVTSCSKPDDIIQTDPTPTKPGDTTKTNPPNIPTCSDSSNVLTNTVWVYYEYFKYFNDSTSTTLAWKTNRTYNIMDLSRNQVKFNCDSTYTEIDEYGDTLKGTWTYLNNGTQIKVTNKKGSFTSTTQVLTAKRYEWLAANGNYGVMLPKNITSDTTGGRLQLLTSKPWIYTEYFNGFNFTNPLLVWKPNKAYSPLNLSKNVVKFNTNGTYTEVTEDGTTLNGTWTFLNNQKQVEVYNSKGTFTSTIMLLNTERYEWVNYVGGTTYGEMVHQ